MDPRIAQLKTPEDCEQVARNVERREPELAKEARRRAVELRAASHGATTDVEREALLAHSQLLTRLRREVDGLGCALSWHSYGGVVGHPMSHVPQQTTGLQPADVVPFGNLTAAMANEAGYTAVRDGFPTLTTVDGCGYSGYAVYGDSDDWLYLYKDGGTFGVLIEAYSRDERGTCATGPTNYGFYPLDTATRDLAAEHNVRAALAMLRRCPEAR